MWTGSYSERITLLLHRLTMADSNILLSVSCLLINTSIHGAQPIVRFHQNIKRFIIYIIPHCCKNVNIHRHFLW